jgi:hypothetical protein
MDVGGGHSSKPIGRGVFFDAVSMCLEHEPEVVLRRVMRNGRERFALLRPIAYWDREHDKPHVIPARLDDFYSDLTSVPFIFAWLVPRTGPHLLAALLHDGLVGGEGGQPTYDGPQVNRGEADLIFRRALCSLGISRARAWLMWTAVTLATIQAEARGGPVTARWRRNVMVGTLCVVAILGCVATLDLFDVIEVLPWMGAAPWQAELAAGAVAAAVVPAALSILWGRLWPAGCIAGTALAWLLHVSALVVALAAGFRLLEWASCWCSVRLRGRGR